ncbi:MAG TPA: enoyl-CoA hydratase/isomerase family protein [Vicinamibacterales bacterium]|nr:enoyl-CoA hydratase/isomerase family protein [Vicinamibacterales bacterium]
MGHPVSVIELDSGAWWRVVLGGSKGNILDTRLTTALTDLFHEAARAPQLKALVIEGDGAHFSFGASVQEHLPDQVAGMLDRFHRMLFALLDTPVVVLAAVRGRCLGGGLELATVCDRVFASPDATLGQPEIALGVFAPAASVALAHRVGHAHAIDLCLTGRTVAATEARAIGLVDEIVDGPPADAALAWARAHLSAKSAASLRLAVRAVRAHLVTALRSELPAIERLYLDELMQTSDAVEGLHAFLEKREPRWRHA